MAVTRLRGTRQPGNDLLP